MGCGICEGGIGCSWEHDYSFGVFATYGKVHEHPIAFDKSHVTIVMFDKSHVTIVMFDESQNVIIVAFGKSHVTIVENDIVFIWTINVNKIYFHPLIECIHICLLQLTCN
jgi:hypothetical protein